MMFKSLTKLISEIIQNLEWNIDKLMMIIKLLDLVVINFIYK